MAKKQPNKTTRGRPKGKKPTNTRKASTKSTRGKGSQNGKENIGINIPATIGGEPYTFTTLKKKAAMLDALKFSMGIVSPAAIMVGISRQTHYAWMKSDAGYADEVHQINESTFDFVETQMLKEIGKGNTIMTIFYAKSKMKARGFVERTEVEVTNKPAFVVKEDNKGVRKVMDVIHKADKTGT